MDQIITFDPTVETLNLIIAETAKITATDLADETQLAVVKKTRLSLRNARTTIEKQGKGMRESALKYQKDVIARERELIGIIEPEESRLKALEDEAAAIKEREARLVLLPLRKEELAAIGITDITDEALLDLDNDQFIEFLNKCKADYLDKQLAAAAAEKARQEEDARLARVAEEARVSERTRLEDEARTKAAETEAAAQKLIDDAKTEANRVLKEAADKVAQEKAQAEAAEREREAEAQRIKDDADKKEAQEKYLEWAKSNGWSADTALDFKTVHTDTTIELWRKVGTYVK